MPLTLDDQLPKLVADLRAAVGEALVRQLYGLPVVDVAPLLEADNPVSAAKVLIARTELQRMRDKDVWYDVFNVRTGNSVPANGYYDGMPFGTARTDCALRNARAKELDLEARYAVRTWE
jgi:hypothetical protein